MNKEITLIISEPIIDELRNTIYEEKGFWLIKSNEIPHLKNVLKTTNFKRCLFENFTDLVKQGNENTDIDIEIKIQLENNILVAICRPSEDIKKKVELLYYRYIYIDKTTESNMSMRMIKLEKGSVFWGIEKTMEGLKEKCMENGLFLEWFPNDNICEPILLFITKYQGWRMSC